MAHLFVAGAQLFALTRVQVVRSLRPRRCLLVPVRFDLATAPRCADGLADLSVERPQLIGKPQRDLEIAMVDCAQFAYQRAPGALALAPCETGHTADHCSIAVGY